MSKIIENILLQISKDYSLDFKELCDKYLSQSNKIGRKCGGCGNYGHNKRTCPVIHPELAGKNVDSKPKKLKKCKYCGELGHNKRTCLKRIHDTQNGCTKTKDDIKSVEIKTKTKFINDYEWLEETFGKKAKVLHSDIIDENKLNDKHDLLLKNKKYLGFIKLNYSVKYDEIFKISKCHLVDSRYMLMTKNNKFIEIFSITNSGIVEIRIGKINENSKTKITILNDDCPCLQFFQENLKIKQSKGYTCILDL